MALAYIATDDWEGDGPITVKGAGCGIKWHLEGRLQIATD